MVAVGHPGDRGQGASTGMPCSRRPPCAGRVDPPTGNKPSDGLWSRSFSIIEPAEPARDQPRAGRRPATAAWPRTAGSGSGWPRVPSRLSTAPKMVTTAAGPEPARHDLDEQVGQDDAGAAEDAGPDDAAGLEHAGVAPHGTVKAAERFITRWPAMAKGTKARSSTSSRRHRPVEAQDQGQQVGGEGDDQSRRASGASRRTARQGPPIWGQGLGGPVRSGFLSTPAV